MKEFVLKQVRNLSIAFLVLPGYVSAQPASGAQALNIIEAGGIRITNFDLEAELSKAPPEVRNGMLFRKESLGQLASNLLMRRVLAAEAEASGLHSKPVNQAALQLARDRVLSDLQLARLDDLNTPTPSVLEQRAREVYKAEQKRFEIAEEVKVSHILVAQGQNAKEEAQAILKQLKSGANFEDLAKEKSADPGSAAKGGDLGSFGRGRMVKPFEDAAFALKVGELSDVVETQFGFHILKLTDRKEAGIKPFEEVRDTLSQEVIQKMRNDGRMKAGEHIMSRAKPSLDALDAFIASQQPSKQTP